MRMVAVAFLAFLALAVVLSRPHPFATLPTKPMPAVNARRNKDANGGGFSLFSERHENPPADHDRQPYKREEKIEAIAPHHRLQFRRRPYCRAV